MRAWRDRIFLIVMIPFLLAPKESIALNCLSERVMNAVSAREKDKKEIEKMLKDLENVEATMVAEEIAKVERAIRLEREGPSEDFILPYLRARVYLIWGEYYQDIKNDKGQAKKALEQALTSVEQAIQLKKDFGDAYRVAGDLYGWLIDLKGAVLYGPLYGAKSEKLLKKAQWYDSGNPETYLALGRKYLYTPRLFGGSRKKAIESFEMAVRLCPDYYLAHLWLGRGYLDRGLFEKAEKAFENALMLKPDGYMAKEELKKVRNR